MSIKYISSVVLFWSLCITSGYAQEVVGKWKTFDENTQQYESVIEVYQDNGKIYAKVFHIVDPEKRGATCIACKDDRKNKPILGLELMTGLKKNGNQWSGGKILDPKSGKEYKCYMELLDENTLKVRGFIGFSLFGKTAIWKRYTAK